MAARKKPRPRQNYTDAQKLAYVEAHADSGLSVDKFARAHELTPSALNEWVKRHRQGQPFRQYKGRTPGAKAKHGSAKGLNWVEVFDYCAAWGVAAAVEEFPISDATIYTRRQEWVKQGKEVPAFATPKAGQRRTVAKPVTKKVKVGPPSTAAKLARRKPEQGNLMPVVEHEPVSIPAFEDAQLEPVIGADANAAWEQLNGILARHMPPVERLRVFGLIHQIVES